MGQDSVGQDHVWMQAVRDAV